MAWVKKMNGGSAFKIGIVDLSAVLFAIGGVVAPVMTVLPIPISSVYPFTLPVNLSVVFLLALAIGLVGSLGAFHCYSLATKRMLSGAGIRGIVFGAILLIFSQGFFGGFRESGLQPFRPW